MKWKTQLQKDKQTLARLAGKQRWLFLWDYYKLPILGVLLALLLAAVGAATFLRSAKTACYAVLVNADNEATADPFTPLLEQGGMELAGKRVAIEANYTLRYDDSSLSDAQTLQVLAALFGIGDLDVFAADEAVFASYGAQGAFVDLALFVPPEVLRRYEDHLYYCENAEGERVLAGLWLRPGSPLHEAGYYAGDVLIGVAANAQNLDSAVLLLRQLLENGLGG